MSVSCLSTCLFRDQKKVWRCSVEKLPCDVNWLKSVIFTWSESVKHVLKSSAFVLDPTVYRNSRILTSLVWRRRGWNPSLPRHTGTWNTSTLTGRVFFCGESGIEPLPPRPIRTFWHSTLISLIYDLQGSKKLMYLLCIFYVIFSIHGFPDIWKITVMTSRPLPIY